MNPPPQLHFDRYHHRITEMIEIYFRNEFAVTTIFHKTDCLSTLYLVYLY